MLDAKDGLRIAFRSWRPAGQARGIVVIVPGFNSHSGYYQWVAEQLGRDGLVVHAIDLRGRGRIGWGQVLYSKLRRLCERRLATHRTRRRPRPRVAGRSFSVTRPAASWAACMPWSTRPNLPGSISESFAFELPAPDFALAAIRGLSHLAPHAHVLRLKNEDFSREPEVVRT